MFIVQDPAVAATICSFYEDPDHNSRWRAELERLELLSKVEPFVNTVQALTLTDFMENDLWTGISKDMDKYLPSFISTEHAYIRRQDVLRNISISASTPIHNMTLKANDLIWFKSDVSGFTKFNIDINMPTYLLRYHINVVADVKPEKVQSMSTFLPCHILNKLQEMKQVIVPIQDKNYYLYEGAMHTFPSTTSSD